MNVIKRRPPGVVKASRIGALALALLAAFPYASAKQRRPSPSQGVMVIAHVALDGKSASDMSIQVQSNGNRYLYIEHSPEQGISILEIEKPSAPKLVSSVAWPGATSAHLTAVIGEAVLLADTNMALLPANQSASSTLALWDTSNPNSPKLVQRFMNVKKVLSDDRGYIYLLNADGLWVVSTPTASQNNTPGSSQESIQYNIGG